MSETLAETIQRILDEEVRPILHAHKGDVELRALEEGPTVRLRLLGMCATCLGAEETVRDVIEATIKERCPAIREVRVETGVSDELIAESLIS